MANPVDTQGFPNVSAALITDAQSMRVAPSWQLFFTALWSRTGGGQGQSTADVAAEAATALSTADAALAQAALGLKKAADLSDVASPATSRTNIGVGSVGTGNTVGGWSAPTGGGSRASINGGFTQTAGALYSQTDTQTLIGQVEALSAALAQLITDATSARVIGP